MPVRVDKWLWCIRFYKSRTLATEACKSGRVKLNAISVKPSFLLKGNETLQIGKNGFQFHIKVEQLIDKRVGAPIAITCYTDLTPEEEKNKFQAWFKGKAAAEFRERGSGRPTKRERRDIDDFKDNQFDFDAFDVE
ncbi:MAG: RNA-binding S4 domain-containing protein [Saprospiraceae bacterium]